MPPPDPRSSTRSPSLRPASAVGLPHPSEMAIDSAGSPASCASSYSVIARSWPDGAQHASASADVASTAVSPMTTLASFA